MTIGQAFKRMREKKGYTRDRLAKKLNAHKNNILNWENDKHNPSLMLLICAADIFECTLDELVGRKEGEQK